MSLPAQKPERVQALAWEAELTRIPHGALKHSPGMTPPAGFKMALVLDEQAPDQNGVYFVPAIELLPPKERVRERARRERERYRAQADAGYVIDKVIAIETGQNQQAPDQAAAEKIIVDLLGEVSLVNRRHDGHPETGNRADKRASPLASASERTRLFLADLDPVGFSLAEARQASDLRHQLRTPSLDVLRTAVLFLTGIHPARPGQREVVTHLLCLLGPERRAGRPASRAEKVQSFWRGEPHESQTITIDLAPRPVTALRRLAETSRFGRH